jgi:hypothetical protein
VTIKFTLSEKFWKWLKQENCLPFRCERGWHLRRGIWGCQHVVFLIRPDGKPVRAFTDASWARDRRLLRTGGHSHPGMIFLRLN